MEYNSIICNERTFFMKNKKILAGIMAVTMVFGSAISASAASGDYSQYEDLRTYLTNHTFNEAVQMLDSEGIYYIIDTFDSDKTLVVFCDSDAWGMDTGVDLENAGTVYYEGSFLYVIENGNVEVVSCEGGEGETYTIPETINGMAVTSIKGRFQSEFAYDEDNNYDFCVNEFGGPGRFDFFKGTSNLIIPDSITEIGEYVLSEMSYYGTKILCHEGSYAQEYAIENDIPYEIIPYETTDSENSSESSSESTGESSSNENSETNSSENSGNSQNSSDENVTTSSESSSENSSSKTSDGSSTAGKTNTASTSNPNTGAAAGLALAAVGLGAAVVTKRRK